MNVQDELPMAPRDLLVLSVLAVGPLHGYGIIKAVEESSESGVLLDPANLYRVLRRMKKAGWIREAMGKGKGGGDGAEAPPRRTYALAPPGRALLAAELARLERLLRHVRPALADADGI